MDYLLRRDRLQVLLNFRPSACMCRYGTAHTDELEDTLECSDRSVLRSKEVEEARTVLATAISFLTTQSDLPRRRLHWRISTSDFFCWQLAEALLSLANADEDAYKALY
ncbi:hypothetical protein EI94DRAFT_1870893 [Lactarius quietus]|nr:hypothetical protein EI94DRAFT_1870893 [Lactarius quietus]